MRVFDVEDWKEFAASLDCKDCANECDGCEGPESLYAKLVKERNYANAHYNAGKDKPVCPDGCDIIRKTSLCCGENPETGQSKNLVLFEDGEARLLKACNNLVINGLCGIYKERYAICKTTPCE